MLQPCTSHLQSFYSFQADLFKFCSHLNCQDLRQSFHIQPQGLLSSFLVINFPSCADLELTIGFSFDFTIFCFIWFITKLIVHSPASNFSLLLQSNSHIFSCNFSPEGLFYIGTQSKCSVNIYWVAHFSLSSCC